MTRMSIQDAAARLNVSVDSVRRRLRSGAIPGERDTRGQWWLDISDSVGPEVPMPSVDQRLALGIAIPSAGSPDLAATLIAALQARIDDLTARLDKSEAERDRLLTLIETLVRGSPATA